MDDILINDLGASLTEKIEMTQPANRRRAGFSLIELVIVIVIIGIISAIAIPRLTRGATNASASALKADLAVMRSAIELYRAEHQGEFPTAAGIGGQLTKFTKFDGTDANDNVDVAGGRIYGPYLASVPAQPVGAKKGSTGISTADAADIGWIYTIATGTIKANTTTETDLNGVLYNTF